MLTNKQYEIILKSLLKEKEVPFKFLRTDRKMKFSFNNNEYVIENGGVLYENEVLIEAKDYQKTLDYLNSIMNFNMYDKLLENIKFFNDIQKEVKVNDVQIKILIPSRQKTVWFESCYLDLDGSLLSFEMDGFTFTFALEEKNIELMFATGSDKKIKNFNTASIDEARLERNHILNDNDLEIKSDADVIVCLNGKEMDRINTVNLLAYVKELIES